MKTRFGQHGAALMVSLMFLVVLTMLGLAAVRATTQQTRMAASMQFGSSAFEAAEGAIRTLYNQIVGSATQPATLLVQAQSTAQTVNFGSSSSASAVATLTFASYCTGSPPANNSAAAAARCCFDIEGAGQYGNSSAASTQAQRIDIGCPLLGGIYANTSSAIP